MANLMKLVDEDGELYKEEMASVIGLIYQVRNSLGAGRSEEIYHQALVSALIDADIPSVSKPRQTLVHRGIDIQTLEPDLIIYDKIILELKVLKDYKQRNFPSYNQQQLLRYLKFNQFKLGLLVNFAHSKVGLCRMIFEESFPEIDEEYSRMMDYVNQDDKVLLRQIRECIKEISRQYGYGYSHETYQKILSVELAHHGIDCVCNLSIPATFQGKVIGSQSTTFMKVGGKFLINVRALIDGLTPHDFLTTRTFLSELGLKVGWVINFGQANITVRATATRD